MQVEVWCVPSQHSWQSNILWPEVTWVESYIIQSLLGSYWKQSIWTKYNWTYGVVLLRNIQMYIWSKKPKCDHLLYIVLNK